MNKLITFGLAAATALSMTGGALMPLAGAVTAAELQAQITALQAQLNAMLGDEDTSTTTCYVWNGNLTIGSTGPDVTTLQNYLTGTGHFSFSGGATGYFGPITQAAVAAWQAANGVAPAVGYWGPISQAKYTSLCGVTPGDGDGGTGWDTPSGDEGNLDNFDQISSLAGEEVGEGEEDVSVLGWEVDAEGADQMIQRVNVLIDEPNGEDDLEDFITEVSVWLDGEELGRMDVEDASYDRATDDYDFRFNGLEGIIEEDATAELEIAVSAVNSVNGDTEGDEWDVEITSIRAASPNGTDEVYDDTEGVSEVFSLETFAASTNLELKASKSDDSPEEDIVVGEENDEFEADLLVFELEAENSDVTVYGLEFDLASAPGTVPVEDMVESLTLECEGDSWSENDLVAGTTTAASMVFGDMELEIADGDTAVCTLSATMLEIDGTDFEESASLSVDLDVSETDAEDESGEGLDGADLTGTANGYEQTFVSEGVVLTNIETSTATTFEADAGGEEDTGKYIIEFDATAYGVPLYLEDAVDTSGTGGNANEGVVIELSSDEVATGTITSAVFECVSDCGNSADNGAAGEFYIDEGDTESFRITVMVVGDDSPNPANFKVWLESVNWDIDEDGTLFYTSNLGEGTDADTGYLYLNAL